MATRIISFFLTLTVLFGYMFSYRKTYADAEYEIRPEVSRDMSKYVGVYSQIKNNGGVPTLYINDKAYTSVAYMTYIESNNDYAGFSEAGYSFFSVPVLFAGRWINAAADIPAFKRGIFDSKGSPDYGLFDEAIKKILAACPDAYIFPRVNISMPEWWENENPDDVNILSDSSTRRESMYSDKWRTDAAKMLSDFVDYVNASPYASHIVGYQIAGGNTEEWFHFDLNAGYCRNAERGFNAFLDKYYPNAKFRGLPDISLLKGRNNYHKSEHLMRFLEYASFAVADAICFFADVVKQKTGDNVVVGTFYGYSLEVTDPLYGTHALKLLSADKNIDFICSPCSYVGTRDSSADWTEMYPADTVRLHGKMCFQELDIRTHLTKPLSEVDPKLDPEKYISAPIWQPVGSKETAVNNIRKAFCRQLIKGNGLWWFDMWGKWYADDDIMSEMEVYRDIYTQSLACEDRSSISEVAVFVDESAYKYMNAHTLRNVIYNQRRELGLIGTSYDIYDVFDFDAVCDNYKAVIFMSGTKTPALKNAVSICRNRHIPYLISTDTKQSFSVKELRAFCKDNGVKIYCETDDIIYINKNYVSIYAVTDGNKTIDLGSQRRIKQLIPVSNVEFTSDSITLEMKAGETVLFAIE